MGWWLVFILFCGVGAARAPHEGPYSANYWRLKPRIVGGRATAVHAWPWQVAIEYAGFHLCGGTLLSSSWVLSAAHCFMEKGKRMDVSFFTLYLGRHLKGGAYAHASPLAEVRIPLNYHTPETGSDIALVRLAIPWSGPWTEAVRPAMLPGPGVSVAANAMCTATGWGDVSTNTPQTIGQPLQQVDIPLVPHQTCLRWITTPTLDFPEPSVLAPHTVCAGFEEGGRDSCQGDSGGPLHCPVGIMSTVVTGIVSYGDGCADRLRPGIYTDLTAFAAHIKSETQDRTILFYTPGTSPRDAGGAVPSSKTPTRPATGLLVWLTACGYLFVK